MIAYRNRAKSTLVNFLIGLLGGEKGWLAADFEADVADGLLVGERVW